MGRLEKSSDQLAADQLYS